MFLLDLGCFRRDWMFPDVGIVILRDHHAAASESTSMAYFEKALSQERRENGSGGLCHVGQIRGLW